MEFPVLILISIIIIFSAHLIFRAYRKPSKTITNVVKTKEECKMVLIIRMDLKMQKGKVAAQCSHATLAAFQRAMVQSEQTRYWINVWEKHGQAKITLKCDDEETMLKLQKEARKRGLVAQSILDAGRTQIAAGSRTVLAIGPAPKSDIDEITGDLKLY